MANNDGQHRSSGNSGAPGAERGQRSRLEPGANVGQKSGGELNMGVPASRKDADISTTSHSAGNLSPTERRPGADDRK